MNPTVERLLKSSGRPRRYKPTADEIIQPVSRLAHQDFISLRRPQPLKFRAGVMLLSTMVMACTSGSVDAQPVNSQQETVLAQLDNLSVEYRKAALARRARHIKKWTQQGKTLEQAQQATTDLEGGLGQDDPRMVQFYARLAQLYQSAGRNAEAEPYYVRVASWAERSPVPPKFVASILADLSDVYFELDRYAEAEATLGKSISYLQDKTARNMELRQDLGNAYILLARACRKQGKDDLAAQYFTKGLAIKQ